uniref:Uncharacterized protein TCIL3000_11_13880 n=1 Tax=Trypanosoma congolense (strain IL3000) TaxID=1068625 RepID=G0V2L0_TRYCI|nr:unnamed protein product [Trypanosoma congolense IL3000]
MIIPHLDTNASCTSTPVVNVVVTCFIVDASVMPMLPPPQAVFVYLTLFSSFFICLSVVGVNRCFAGFYLLQKEGSGTLRLSSGMDMSYPTHSTGNDSDISNDAAYNEHDAMSPKASNYDAAERMGNFRARLRLDESEEHPRRARRYNIGWGTLTEEMTVADNTDFLQGADIIVEDSNEKAMSFSFASTSRDVMRFHSCIAYMKHRSTRNAIPPDQVGPFNDEVLCLILPYVSLDMREILQVGQVCRYWRFYANLSPHWSYYRRLDWGRRLMQLPGYLRKMVGRPRIVTRDEYFRERRKLGEADTQGTSTSTVQHLHWCVAVALLSGMLCVSNFLLSHYFGTTVAAHYDDSTLGCIVFAVLLTVVVVQIVLVIIPLGWGVSPGKKQDRMRLLAWAVFLLLTGTVLGTITTLTVTRVESVGELLSAPVVELASNETCELADIGRRPAFANLPASLDDIRWRPITTGDEGKEFQPHCVSHMDKSACFVLLYFDAEYTSPVFHNATSLASLKHAGTRYALGFDPFNNTKAGGWCAAEGRPQVVAVTMPTYLRLLVGRDLNYVDGTYLDPLRRPKKVGSVRYQCSVKYPRIVTEEPPGASDIWYRKEIPWHRHQIPLVTDSRNTPEFYAKEYDHYLYYTYACYSLAALLWFLLFVLQCSLRNHSLMVLGLVTTCALILMNPVALLVAGVLCITTSDYYLICNETAGGAMIGVGIFLTALVLAVYVCFW